MTLRELDYRVAVPDWALSYLINGDSSGITEEDRAQCDEWISSYGTNTTIDCYDSEGEFCHSPAFGLACNVVRCTIWSQ